MDPKIIEAYMELFNNEGWKIFIEDLQGDFQAGNNLLEIQDEKSFWQMKGRLQVLSEILAFEQMLKLNLEAQDDPA